MEEKIRKEHELVQESIKKRAEAELKVLEAIGKGSKEIGEKTLAREEAYKKESKET